MAEALKLSFPTADAFMPLSLTLSASERLELEHELGSKIYSPAAAAYEAKKGKQSLGLAFVDEELGKHLPMSMLVALDAQGRVARVELLSYRERYGQGVQSPRFMGQFKGKDLGQKLIVGEDLDAVSGATISSKAVSLGVRKSLRLARRFKESKR